MRHRIAHWFGWNHGEVHTQWVNDRLYVSFYCVGCGRFLGVADITRRTSVRADAGEGR